MGEEDKSIVRSELPTDLLPLRWRVTQEQIWAYAAVTGANDPMHVDPAFARTTAFGGPIAQGLLVFASLSELFMKGLSHPACWVNGGKLAVRFRAPARPGDLLEARAVLLGSADSEGKSYLQYEVSCENETGTRIITGSALVPERRE